MSRKKIMKHTRARASGLHGKLWNKRKLKTNGTNARSDMYNTREKLALERFAWADTQKGFRHRPFADADLIVLCWNARWRFLPRGRTRVNVISAYCLSRENVRSLAKASAFARARHLMRSAWDRDYIVTMVIRTHVLMRADYPLYPPDKIEMYHPYKRGKLYLSERSFIVYWNH